MRVRRLFILTVWAALAAWPLIGAAPVPRQSPGLTIVEPAGKQTELSSFKGKVVAVEFLLTNCPHCWRLAQTMTRLQKELGPRGFQAIAVAFDANVSGPVVTDFAGHSRITFPVGSATADQVDAYLGRQDGERFQVPQLVIIDRAGMIRAQSRPVGEANLEDESSLRTLIDSLLKENPTPGPKPAAATPPPSAKPAAAPPAPASGDHP
jgi:peroxiredoxin